MGTATSARLTQKIWRGWVGESTSQTRLEPKCDGYTMCYSLSLYTDLRDGLRLPPLMWGWIADSSEAIRHPSFYLGTISYLQHCVLSQLLAPLFFHLVVQSSQ